MTTQLELDNRMAAESRLISMGLRSPLPPLSPGELPWEERIKAHNLAVSKMSPRNFVFASDKEPQEPLDKT